MRQYYIVSGILLILSITDFALAAPILVQEKRQASADVVHIPKDLRTVLWERGGDEELVEWLGKGIKGLDKQVDPKPSVAHASSSAAPPGPDHGSTNVLPVEPPTVNPGSSTANPYPVLESSSPWSPLPGGREPMWPGNIRKRPLTDPNPDSVLPPPKKPALSEEPGQAYEDQAEHVPVSGSFVSQPESSEESWPTESDFEEVSSDEEVNQEMGGQAVAKGKAKQLRRVSGTARDVSNAAQRELQPAERSLDPGK